MSAWFNLKMLGSAALALGISAVSLCPETASANIFLFFNGTCNTSGCPDTTSSATGVLTLTNDYVFGTDITVADFVSFSYTSAIQAYTITSITKGGLAGGLNEDGSLVASSLLFISAGPLFQALPGDWFSSATAEPGTADTGWASTFTNLVPPIPAVPEPSTWAMMLIGFAGLGYASHHASRKSTALAA
jgi:hypothetical protein